MEFIGELPDGEKLLEMNSIELGVLHTRLDDAVGLRGGVRLSFVVSSQAAKRTKLLIKQRLLKLADTGDAAAVQYLAKRELLDQQKRFKQTRVA